VSMNIRDKHDKHLRTLSDTARTAITDVAVTAVLDVMLRNMVLRKLRLLSGNDALRSYLIRLPDCGKPCGDENYHNCNCIRCAYYLKQFWYQKDNEFSDADIATIKTFWDDVLGFLDPLTGCKLSRSLRPLQCIKGICPYTTGADLDKYDPDLYP